MPETYGYVGTSRPRVHELAGSDPETQRQQLLAAGAARLDTMGNIHNLQRRGVRIRSLADNEQFCAQYLDAAPDSPESFLGYTLAGFAAWVSDQELVSIRRRTKAGAGCPSWRGGHRRLQVEWRTSFGKIEAFWGSRPPKSAHPKQCMVGQRPRCCWESQARAWICVG